MLLCLASCGKQDDGQQAAVTHENELPIVDIDVAHSRKVDLFRNYTANVEADNINNISPAMSNRIESIRADIGDHVRKGQVLVTLDASTAEQQRVTLEQLQRDYDRAVKLLEIGAGTQSAVDQVKAQLDAQTALYRNTMTNTVLTAPISGVVTARNYDPGDMTGQQPVLTIGQISPNVKVMININESDIASINRGSQVDVVFDAFPGEKFTGKISRLSPAVDINSRTFPAEVLISNPAEKIKPGMFARVEIRLGDRDNVVVPDRAVVKQTGSANKYVYTYSNGKVAFRKVELGERLDDAYELLSGISDGDTVVVAGQVRLVDGAEVELLNKSDR